MTEPTDDTLFDVWLCHALHGYSTIVTPSWSLGAMTIATCAGFATFMDAAAKHLGLEYFEGEPVIREIARVSKPGRRVYASVKALPRINNGLGVAIVSTPKGVMADHDAREANVGGEIICTVF